MSSGSILTPWRCRAVVALAVLAAYLVPLWNADFNDEVDDARFTYENEHIKGLTPARALRFFTDKTTLDGLGLWEGTYRPIRTLDFAVDWAISGKSARTFHLHSLLYHLIAALLVLELFRRLAPGSRGGPLLGALFFALHPAHTECVAWITSRGDLLVFLFFVGAASLHLTRRYVWSTLLFVLALLSKEAAVVFPAAVLFLDLLVRGRGTGTRLISALFKGEFRTAWREASLPLAPYLVYGALAGAYYLTWRGMMANPGHLELWWGGSYGGTLLTMARGLLYYARTLALPVLLVYDYHVPGVPGLDAGAIAGLILLATVLFGCIRGSARFRFAAAWFFITMLPTSNLVQTVGIPTAERFLYLPSLGFAFWAGGLAASVRPRRVAVAGGVAAVLCLGALTFARAGVWKSADRLFEDSARKAMTPRTRVHFGHDALTRALAAHEEIQAGNRDPALRGSIRRAAERVVRLAADQVEEYEITLRIRPAAPAGILLSKAANALVLLDRPAEAYAAAKRSIEVLGRAGVRTEPHPHFNAGLAARRLGLARLEGIDLENPRPRDREAILRAAEFLYEAAEELSTAHEIGYSESDLRRPISGNLAAAADLRARALGLGGTAGRNRELASLAGRDFLRAALLAEGTGDLRGAIDLYRRSMELAPNPEARSALRRLER